MKLVVVGGSGLIVSKLVTKLREDGFDAAGADRRARYFGATLDDRSLIPGDDAHIAPIRFEDWLSRAMENEAHAAQTGRRP